MPIDPTIPGRINALDFGGGIIDAFAAGQKNKLAMDQVRQDRELQAVEREIGGLMSEGRIGEAKSRAYRFGLLKTGQSLEDRQAAMRDREIAQQRDRDYYAMLAGVESGGNLTARNPQSTATGPYQFTEGTWSDLASQRPDLQLTPEGRTDADQNERAIRAFTERNAAALQDAGIPPNPTNLYAAHFLGAGGAVSFLSADPQASVEDVVSEEALQANRNVFYHRDGRPRTVAQVKQRWRNQFSGATSPVQPQGGLAADLTPEQRSILGIVGREEGMEILADRAFRDADTRDIRNYRFAVEQARQAGQEAPGFTDWMRQNRRAGAPRSVGTIPSGQQLVYDEQGRPIRLENIPGGPQDQEAQAAEAARTAQAEQTQRYGNIILSDIGRAMEKIENAPWYSPTAGFFGNILKNVGGTPAADVQALTTTIRASIAFDRLQAMREASPNGGALGQITERELERLEATLGSLSQAQSEEQLLENLDRLNEIHSAIMAKAAAYPNAAEFGFGGSPGVPAAPAAQPDEDIDALIERYAD